MTAALKTALRERQYTYYEMLAFAQFYQTHRNENSPENLLANYLKWRKITDDVSLAARRLMVIEECVVSYYGLALQDVRGKRRYTELVRARQVISHFAVKYASQYTVANTIGIGRNNVQYGKSKCGQLMETEKLLCKEVADIEKRLEIPMAELQKEEDKIAQSKNEENEQPEQTAQPAAAI